MASIITGLKVTELTNLSLGSTGTRVYAVSAAGNSYQMSMNGLSDTLSGLYFNNIYQPKAEDDRFVHTTGDEIIYGGKSYTDNQHHTGHLYGQEYIPDTYRWYILQDGSARFVNQVEIPYIKNVNSATAVSLSDSILYDFNSTFSVDWGSRYLQKSDNSISLNWEDRIISGVWNIQQLRPIAFLLTGTAPATATSAGISGQIARSGQFLYIATGTNKWGKIQISNF